MWNPNHPCPAPARRGIFFDMIMLSLPPTRKPARMVDSLILFLAQAETPLLLIV